MYRAIDALIAELQASGQPELAGILHHRLHRVAWATGTELLEELQRVLTQALDKPTPNVSEPARADVARVLALVDRSLAGAESRRAEIRHD